MAARSQAEASKHAQPGEILIVIHAFEARSPDELSLVKGQRIELVEKDDDFGDGWYLGKHTDETGRTGLFPEVYTKVAPSAPSGPNATRTQRSSSTPNAAPRVPPPPQPVSANKQVGHGVVTLSPSSLPADTKSPSHPGSSPYQGYSQPYQSTPPPLNPSTTTTTTTTQRTVSAPSTGFPSPAVSSAPPTQRSISLMMDGGGSHIEDGSPVLNETLSVIDEHITDMNTPRSSIFAHNLRHLNDSESDYDGHPARRFSYINGNETDEEERNAYSVAEVNRWTAGQVAEFLEDLGIERQHCDVFREQEITGEVLLNLDQASIFMKEFDLGLVGRRLRTWQKIKNFQDEVRSHKRESAGKRARHSQTPGSESNVSASHIPATAGGHQLRQSSPLVESHSPIGSARASFQPTARDSASKSAMAAPNSHARRHSSLDAQSKLSQLIETTPPAPSPTGHSKKPSFDRNWTMSSSGSPAPTRTSFLAVSTRSRTGSTVDLESTSDGTRDMDRGYLSGSELDSKRQRNVLRKRDTAVSTHSRQSSYKENAPAPVSKRHSRFGSAGSFIAALASGGRSQDDSTLIPNLGSDNKEPTTMIGDSPVVTRLEYDSPKDTNVSRKRESQLGDSSRSSLNQPAASKAVTDLGVGRGDEKYSSVSSTPVLSPGGRLSTGKDAPLQSPTRTTSTSGASKSTDPELAKQKTTTPGLTPTSGTKRAKNKKQTSAYTRGLQKVSPREAMAKCDYSGWMKKKSPSLIATWKPRLFVLQGRRLSYYYSEEDGEEQGLIDISNHKVLPADDILTGLHATVTGAKSSPTSPANAQTETMNEAEVAAQIESTLQGSSNESIFIFKLVPPRAGLSRAVNFTKPTVHYFAVDNIRQGRLWMAALMKATIQMDSTKPMVTTYGQKTISLAKAQQMKQRPPNLQDVDEDEESRNAGSIGAGGETDDTGLKIQGLDMSYEYVASNDRHESSVNGEPETEGGPSSAPLLNRAQGPTTSQGPQGGRTTASYQDGQNSLRLVRSLSGGLSHHSRPESDREHVENSDLYAANPGSRPSTSASKQSHGSRMRARSTNASNNTEAAFAMRTAMAKAE